MSNKNPKIKGILFKHSEDDYSIWMPDLAKNEEKKILQALVAAYGNSQQPRLNRLAGYRRGLRGNP